MKNKILLLAIIIITASTCAARKTPRSIEDFDFGWKFTKSDTAADYSVPDTDTRLWQEVQLPHDWNICDTFDINQGGAVAYLPEGTGWYIKKFAISESDITDRSVSIVFDGIFMQSDVWINGHHLGHRPYGFCAIEYNLTPWLEKGENTIAVRADTHGGRPRWYAGAGIYRHVKLHNKSNVHIPVNGTFVTTPLIENDKATVDVTTTVFNSGKTPKSVVLRHSITDKTGKTIAKSKPQNISLAPGDSINVNTNLHLSDISLWSPDSPVMYKTVSEILDGNSTIDRYETAFGIRSFKFDADRGFSINGKPLKLKGMCLHMDDGARGVAVPDRSYERRLQILKDYGCNAIRCSHNQPSAEFLNICDTLGLLVIDEAFDKWKSGYYEKYFEDWWQRDLENMIVRDRNHPSIILWSIGNELQEAWNDDDEGVARATMLRDFTHSLDNTRPVNLAGQNGHKSKFSQVADVTGYNYLEARMLNDHKTYPDKPFLITEELPYYHGEEGNIRAYSTLNPWNIVRDNDFIAGGFIWTGVDHIGECGWPEKGYPNGLFDICMHEKPRAAYHRSQWRDDPMVSIAVYDTNLDIAHGRDLWQWPKMASMWNFPQHYQGMIMQLCTITNCEEVELYFNSKLMGRTRTDMFPNNTIVWNMPYQPGVVEAVGYNGGSEAARYRIATAGNAEYMTSSPDRTEIKADGQDLCYIDIALIDKDGILAQHDNRNITVTVEGNGRFLGIDSGDVRRNDTFFKNNTPTFFGRALACIQASRTPGIITVTIKADGIDTPNVIEIATK